MRHYTAIFLTILLLGGCSSGGAPVSPDLTSDDINRSPSSVNLWGYWDIEYDVTTGQLEITPLRSASGTWNVTMFLQPPAGSPTGLGVQILDASDLISNGRIDVQVTVNHPFPSMKLRGFDIRGVVLGDSSMIDPYNSSIQYAGENDLRLLNADGYTRWMNPAEFHVAGILGYVEGALGTSGYLPDATINGYKYFADSIEPDGNVYDYFASAYGFVAMRGSMNPGTSLSRDYHLQFPTSPLQVKFQYAIIASWEKALSGGMTPGVNDFPNEANSFEPVAISVVDSSTLFYESASNKGGNIDLRLNIVDWWAYWDPTNLSDYIGKIVVSSDSLDLAGGSFVEFDFSTLDQYPASAGNAEGVDIFIGDVEPSGLENQEILISIEMTGYDYSNPFGVPNGTDGDPLAAYFRYTFEVAPDINDPPVVTSGVTGPTNVFVMDTETYSVVVSDPDGPFTEYEWTIRDELTGDLLYGPDPGDGAGNWVLDWSDAYIPGEVEIFCTVNDGDNQDDANPLKVTVSDEIFHANLNDITTGDNAGWSYVEQIGMTHWSDDVGDDDHLAGYGYKFGIFNTMYFHESASILMTPEIPLASNLEHVYTVVLHSYEFEYYAPFEIGFDGGNFKCTQAPTTPVYSDPEMPITGGKDYEGWLFDTAINGQLAYFSDVSPETLHVSAYEIPPGYIGSSVYLGFAAATDEFTTGENHGWMIDDVSVRALPTDANAPPIPYSQITGDILLPMLDNFPGTYEVIAYDVESDPLSYAWTVRIPGTGEIIWGPVIVDNDQDIVINWMEVGTTGELEVHCSVYDGFHPGVAAPPLPVTIQEVVFHADLTDTTTGDNAGWTEIIQVGASGWTTEVGEDSILNGYGYKFGEFDASYLEDSRGILLSPPISVPADVARASLYVLHDFNFRASLDGGNFKVTIDPLTPNFLTVEENIDGGFDYDVELTGTVMDGQDAFGIGQLTDTGLISRMDLLNSQEGKDIRLGIACASGITYFNMRGWLIDDIVLAITP